MDLKSSFDELNYWKNNDILNFSQYSVQQFKMLDNFAAMEVIFKGTQGDETKVEALHLNWKKYLAKQTIESNKKTYLYICNFKAFAKNRIRTYKGIFPGSIDSKDIIAQAEVEIFKNHSIIGGFLEINNSNLDYTAGVLLDSSISFLLQTDNRNLISPDTIRVIIEEYMLHSGQSEIMFFKLLSFLCVGSNYMMRAGGDGGDYYISLQIFGLKYLFVKDGC